MKRGKNLNPRNRKACHSVSMVVKFTQEPALNCVQVRDKQGGKP
jgi:hypothetical protein